LKKENMMGQVQWDTRYGRKDPPVEDGEEAEEAEMDSIFFEWLFCLSYYSCKILIYNFKGSLTNTLLNMDHESVHRPVV